MPSGNRAARALKRKQNRMFDKLLIANRGEIACRIIRSAKALGVRTIAVYSDADKEALHVKLADEAVHIGASPANQSYLLADRIIEACKATGADAVHPGYGFLSENAGFAAACKKAGIIFVGPPPKAIEAMGDKITSKKLAAEAGVSTVPGFMGIISDADEAVKIAGEIGYPVMIKASAGGGGKGMRIAWDEAEAREGFERSTSEARSSFGDDRVFIEKFIVQPRHIEIQVLADSHGNCIHLGERECSIQRRNQKVLEEAPSPFIDAKTRAAMGEQAVALSRAVGYESAGTVEFIVDQDRNFYFLEMNTRLQVEHPVTELVYGLDLVEWMLRIASGEKLDIAQSSVMPNGWALESRIYAEDPYRNFLPSIGRLTRYRPLAESSSKDRITRIDTGVMEGGEISTYYDPLICKVITWGKDRDGALDAMADALDGFELEGVGHNIPFLAAVVDQKRFRDGNLSTAYIDEEFPDGFDGVKIEPGVVNRLAAIAAASAFAFETRGINGTGLEAPMARSVLIGEQRWDFAVSPGKAITLTNAHGEHIVEGGWLPGDNVAKARVDGHDMLVRMDRLTAGFRIRYRGAEMVAKVLLPHVADLMGYMPIKEPPDLSKLLICPMPGQLVRLDVAEGETVEQGQALAVVEAMKMENVLRAEKRSVVSHVRVEVGASLAVDEIIMEFSEV
jgi:propionyl-CoA carboxylase alpha chain